MKKLESVRKITLATLKSFAKRNKDNLFCLQSSHFDGMTDGIEFNRDAQFTKTELNEEKIGYYKTGIQGVYTVGSSRDYLTRFENSTYFGIEIYNCCGTSILAVKKNEEAELVDFAAELL